jgi:hypothetical protein
MKTSLIMIHLGLGDLILCNGLIREIQNKNDFVFVPIKSHNLFNFKDLFKDNKKIKPLIAETDANVFSYSKSNFDHIIRTGIFSENINKIYNNFCEGFYSQANVEYLKRWSSFYYENNKEKQTLLYDKLVTNDDYIFVHEDIKRNLLINTKFDNVVTPNHKFGDINEYSIFDYLKILENAKEIHCIDSSFACFIDHIKSLKDKPKFIHRYVRKYNENPTYKNNWIIVNE